MIFFEGHLKYACDMYKMYITFILFKGFCFKLNNQDVK